ncbi:cation transporter [Sphingomonadaceae bacterium G21617-S1]|nr:cation transporter [Sphingomonadaceae bacterium G21617-S1]
MDKSENSNMTAGLRAAVRFVAIANLAYFGIEFAVALSIGSVSLFADSVDFLEDTSINLLILLALGWTAAARARTGKFLALLILVPGIAAVWTAVAKFGAPVTPDANLLTITGAGALLVNCACAIRLARHRHGNGGLTRAAFLSARNDVLANIAIIAAGIITAMTLSFWPDLIVGMGIALLNLDAAKEIWEASNSETADLEAEA